MRRVFFLLLFLPLFIFAQNVTQLELNDFNGETFVMKDNLDHDATIISFWATWCLPCKKEHPALQKLKEQFSDKDLQIITISQDSPRSLAKVKNYVKSKRYDFTYLVDPNREVSNQLLVTSVPYTMIVDKSGKVVYTHSGYRKGDEKELEKELLKLWKAE